MMRLLFYSVWFFTRNKILPRPSSSDAIYCSRVNGFIEEFGLNASYAGKIIMTKSD